MPGIDGRADDARRTPRLRTAERPGRICFETASFRLSTARYRVSDNGVRNLLMSSSNDSGAGTSRVVAQGDGLAAALIAGYWRDFHAGGPCSYYACWPARWWHRRSSR